MRIVIVGAGAVGSYLAQRLAVEGQDVVVVEADPVKAEEVQDAVDCLVVTGNGASPASLEEAGIKDAELLIAVTNSDAVNILACHAAARMGVPRKIARVEDLALQDELAVLGVDYMIDPVAELARELLLLARKGGVSEVINFADGRLVLIGGYVQGDSEVAGIHLAELRERVEGWDWLVTGLVRDGETIIARGDTTVQEGDHLLLMAKTERTDQALKMLGLRDKRAEKVMIIGATRLAQITAELFARNGMQTVLVDEEAERCRELSLKSDRIVVVQGDPTDPRVLEGEGVSSVDLVLALTGWDEVNILSSLVAKAKGARRTVARFHRFEYVGLLPGIGIDAGVSTRLAAANAILRFVRRGQIHSVVTFQDTDAEAIELQVEHRSEAVGKTLIDISLPKSVIIGGILRGDDAFVPHGSTKIQPGDRLIAFAKPDAIPAIEKIFA